MTFSFSHKLTFRRSSLVVNCRFQIDSKFQRGVCQRKRAWQCWTGYFSAVQWLRVLIPGSHLLVDVVVHEIWNGCFKERQLTLDEWNSTEVAFALLTQLPRARIPALVCLVRGQ